MGAQLPVQRTIVIAGIPATNLTLYHEIRFAVGDPAALVCLAPGAGGSAAVRHLIVRDIELARARRHAVADECSSPGDHAPPGGLSGDRETATAQATAQLLRERGVGEAWTDRTLPMIFAHHITDAGITLHYDETIGVTQRRAKDDAEVEHLREAQLATERAMEMACAMVARATPDAQGVLRHDGEVLTSERVREAIDIQLLREGYQNPASIVAGGAQGADCHDTGSGPLRTGEPVIIDIFPRNRTTLYNGDCTRTVVNGTPTDTLVRMHEAVLRAKAGAIAITRAGVTGEAVHAETARHITDAGFAMGMPESGSTGAEPAMVHGTGHGVGLEVHEPPLLDRGGPELVEGDALTIEPGLYSTVHGGVRVEDMVIVRAGGAENLNTLHEGLDWA